MAILHISFNHSTPHGNKLANSLDHLEQGLEGLNDVKSAMALMIDGDGTQEAHFTSYVIDKFGFADAAGAKASWDEINSVLGKLNSDAQQTFVNAAILQVVHKHR